MVILGGVRVLRVLLSGNTGGGKGIKGITEW